VQGPPPEPRSDENHPYVEKQDMIIYSTTITIHLTTVSKLEIINLGEIKEFLGVEIIRNRSDRSISICQIVSDSDGLFKIDEFLIMFLDSAILRSLLRFLPLCGYTRGLV
jgi:hypothetical protein